MSPSVYACSVCRLRARAVCMCHAMCVMHARHDTHAQTQHTRCLTRSGSALETVICPTPPRSRGALGQASYPPAPDDSRLDPRARLVSRPTETWAAGAAAAAEPVACPAACPAACLRGLVSELSLRARPPSQLAGYHHSPASRAGGRHARRIARPVRPAARREKRGFRRRPASCCRCCQSRGRRGSVPSCCAPWRWRR